MFIRNICKDGLQDFRSHELLVPGIKYYLESRRRCGGEISLPSSQYHVLHPKIICATTWPTYRRDSYLACDVKGVSKF